MIGLSSMKATSGRSSANWPSRATRSTNASRSTSSGTFRSKSGPPVSNAAAFGELINERASRNVSGGIQYEMSPRTAG